MTDKEIAEKMYHSYVELRKAGFEEPQVLGLLSQALTHLLMQTYLTENSNIKIIIGGGGKDESSRR